jgi:hypothetical protein
MVPSATELEELDTLELDMEVDTLELDLEVDTLELETLLGALEEPPVQQLNCAQAVSTWPPAVVPMVIKYLTTAPAGIALTV